MQSLEAVQEYHACLVQDGISPKIPIDEDQQITENVLLDADGHVKIADFGLSIKKENPSQLTCGSDEYGTISYLARTCPVDVVIIQGNHDYERMFYAGEFLKAFLYRVLISSGSQPAHQQI